MEPFIYTLCYPGFTFILSQFILLFFPSPLCCVFQLNQNYFDTDMTFILYAHIHKQCVSPFNTYIHHFCEISGFHGSESKDNSFLGYCAV
jgi:hypothetical protein